MGSHAAASTGGRLRGPILYVAACVHIVRAGSGLASDFWFAFLFLLRARAAAAARLAGVPCSRVCPFTSFVRERLALRASVTGVALMRRSAARLAAPAGRALLCLVDVCCTLPLVPWLRCGEPVRMAWSVAAAAPIAGAAARFAHRKQLPRLQLQLQLQLQLRLKRGIAVAAVAADATQPASSRPVASVLLQVQLAVPQRLIAPQRSAAQRRERALARVAQLQLQLQHQHQHQLQH